MSSTIEWTDRHDWNPIRGCTRISPGCGGPGPHGGCYAEAMAARFSDPAVVEDGTVVKPAQWGHRFAERTPAGGRWTGRVELMVDRVTLPLRWARGVAGRNKRFVTSTSDPFHEGISDIEIDLLFAVMALRPDWIFQVLTKRSARMREYILNRQSGKHRWEAALDAVRTNQSSFELGDALEWLSRRGPLPNVWLGVSVEDQQRADERIPDLLATPAATRWISAEPLIGPVDLEIYEPAREMLTEALTGDWQDNTIQRGDGSLIGINSNYGKGPKLDWVVTGGESGPRHRDNNFEANARSLRDQCAAAGVAFFGKQGLWHWPDAETEGFA